jgi:hypothetical protein
MWYQGLSRPIFVFAAACILLSIFLRGNGLFKAVLSGSNLRFFARTLAIACTLVILVIQWLFNATENGIYLTFPVCLLFGVGFIIATLLLSAIVMVMFEFPLLRLYHLTLLPYFSHDKFLSE